MTPRLVFPFRPGNISSLRASGATGRPLRPAGRPSPPPGVRAQLALAALAPFLLLSACGSRSASYRFDPERAVHPHFSPERAYRHVEQLVEIGPHPSGSQGLRKAAAYIEDELKASGWAVQKQEFEDQTPLGAITFLNLRARFPHGPTDDRLWTRPVTILVGSHYDTKYFPDIYFVGANDGGSSTGILLEMARVLPAQPALARRLELVFFDGEEAIVDFSATDGLYGSRHYARTITRRQPPRDRPKAVVILDLLGEKSLNVQVPSDTPAHLRTALFAAARELGYASYFGVRSSPILDDHVPFQNEGVPAIDIIDLDYAAWHTSRDTLSQISEKSLGISGKTALLLIEKYLFAP